MPVVKKTGGVKEFHDSGEVEPLEPERARKIKQGYKEAKARKGFLHYSPQEERKPIIERHSEDYIKKHFDKEPPAKHSVSKGLLILFVIAIIGFSALYFFFNQESSEDLEERIFAEANGKCSIYVESFCPTKQVEVQGETFDCLWNRKEQICKVWWKK